MNSSIIQKQPIDKAQLIVKLYEINFRKDYLTPQISFKVIAFCCEHKS
jgi:hypothetical protein